MCIKVLTCCLRQHFVSQVLTWDQLEKSFHLSVMPSTVRDGVGKALQRQDFTVHILKIEFMAFDLHNNVCLMWKSLKKKLPVSHSTVEMSFDILINILSDFFQSIYAYNIP